MKHLKAVPACYTNIQLNAGYISPKLLMTLNWHVCYYSLRSTIS